MLWLRFWKLLYIFSTLPKAISYGMHSIMCFLIFIENFFGKYFGNYFGKFFDGLPETSSPIRSGTDWAILSFFFSNWFGELPVIISDHVFGITVGVNSSVIPLEIFEHFVIWSYISLIIVNYSFYFANFFSNAFRNWFRLLFLKNTSTALLLKNF